MKESGRAASGIGHGLVMRVSRLAKCAREQKAARDTVRRSVCNKSATSPHNQCCPAADRELERQAHLRGALDEAHITAAPSFYAPAMMAQSPRGCAGR